MTTGSLASIIGAIFSFHARFIRLEDMVKSLHKSVSGMRRDVWVLKYGHPYLHNLPHKDKGMDDKEW